MRKDKGTTSYMAATDENVKMLRRCCRASAGPRPSISGMRKLYWGKDAHIVKCGQYAYLM